MNDPSHFPLVVLYKDTNEAALVWTPEQIESGRTFTVVATEVGVLKRPTDDQPQDVLADWRRLNNKPTIEDKRCDG